MDWLKVFSQFLHNPEAPLLFHTGFFLLIFSVFLLAYATFCKDNKLRNIFVILFGFYFYYKASGLFLLLLIVTISADYLFSMLMERQRNRGARKAVLTVAILFSLSFLLFFKYSVFFVENLGFVVEKDSFLDRLVLPIGISFYTFQSISYLVDIYKEKIVRPSYSDYLMYMSFFPHLVAGPIVRARDFLPQLKNPVTVTKSNLDEALFLITKGLVKKAIIGDYVAQYSDAIFAQPDGFSGTENVIGSLCYTMQIFCDFSGYTDMAIGVALLLGFRLGLNFDSPYKALNITDFWRRWHISLSSWLRDYIYIPLGGNRRGPNLQLLFLLTTMLIGGFWHGASWKFVFWGAGHGILLIIHKLFIKLWPTPIVEKPKAPLVSEVHHSKDWQETGQRKQGFTWQTLLNPFWWFLTFGAVSLLWIPFRADTWDTSMAVYKRIFPFFDEESFVAGVSKVFSNPGEYLSYDWEILKNALDINPLLFVLLGIGFAATLQPGLVKRTVRRGYDAMPFVLKMLLLVVLIQLFLQVGSDAPQPFIYFQF